MGAVLVVAAIAVAAIAFAGGSDDESAAGGGDVCRRQEFPGQGQRHLRPGQQPPKSFKYNSFPPTSGYHDATPAIFDAYSQPVPERHLIHNLEHGGIVVQYGSGVPQSDVDAVTRFYREDPTALVLAPLPKLGDKIALTAWNSEPPKDPNQKTKGKGVLAECTKFDEGAFRKFRDTYRFKGPERIPPDQLQPGM